MANESQLIQIPDNYIWDQRQAEAELARVLAAAARGERTPYVPGSRSITDTIKDPAQLAATYPMNAVNEAIGLGGSTGYKVPGAAGKTLFDLLQAGEAMARGKMAPQFQGAVGQSLTGETPSEIDLRSAQAQKLRADAAETSGAGGGLNMKNEAVKDLMNSIGSPEYDKKSADYVGQGLVSLKDYQKVEQQRKARTVVGKEREGLNFAENAYNKIGKLGDLYEQTSAAKSGKMSEDLKLALAAQSTVGGATAEMLTKLSAEDRAFVAQYGLLGLDLRGLAGDSRFSNFDAEKALGALGNPGAGSKLYRERQGAVMDDIAMKHRTAVKNLTIDGKRMQQTPPLLTRAEKTPTVVDVADPKKTFTGTPEQMERAVKSGKYRRLY